jgi:hypothetical protein
MYGGGVKPVIEGDGLAEDAVLLKNQEYWEIRNRELTNAGSTPSIRRGGSTKPSRRSKASFNKLFPSIKGMSCLGSSVRLMGHRRVPEPPARTTAYLNVSTPSQRSGAD